MDQMAIDTTEMTLERNQSILLKKNFGLGELFLQVVTSNFSFHLSQLIVESTLLFLAVVCFTS